MATETTTGRKFSGIQVKFLQDFGHRWMDAWNRGDAEGVANLCTPNVIYDDPALPATAHGRRDVADFVRSTLRAFPDGQFSEPEPPYASRTMPKALAPWHFEGTHTGIIDPPGFYPTGKRVILDGTDHWWFEDGLVARYRADYDLSAVARQIGAMPEAGSAMEKVGVGIQRLQVRGKRRFQRS